MDYFTAPEEYRADEFVLRCYRLEDEPRTSRIYAALRTEWTHG